jgi:hypothetical protein
MVFTEDMNSTTRTRRTARYYAQQIACSQRLARQYAELAEHAMKLHDNGPSPMWDEAHRLRTIAAEYDQDVDDTIEQAMLDGYTFDDIEAA